MSVVGERSPPRKRTSPPENGPARERSPPGCLPARAVRRAAAERFRKGFAGALEGTRAALVLADRIDDDVLRFKALAQLSWLGGMVGDAETPAYRERALDVATASGDARMLREANALMWRMLIDSSSIDAARVTLEQEHREWRGGGE